MDMKNIKDFSKMQAVIVGGSIGGLLSAYILAKYFNKVIIIEKDSFDETHQLGPRKGVPQGGNGHLITIKGMKILSALFPHLSSMLASKNAKRIDMLEATHFYFGEWMPNFKSHVYGRYLTRGFLEYCIRSQVEKIHNISFLYDHTVKNIVTDVKQNQIIGVDTINENIHTLDRFTADLIVDASGRHTHFPLWIEKCGYEKIKKTNVKIKAEIYYSTYLFRYPKKPLQWKGIILGTGYKHGTRSGGLIEIEKDNDGRRIQVNLVGRGVYPGNTITDFIAYSKTLLQNDIYEIIKDAEVIPNSGAFFKFTESIRRHYEKAKKLPQGFIAIGDALNILNPVFGQGITACALEVLALDELLQRKTPLDKLPKKYFKKASQVINQPWTQDLYHDFIYPGTEGKTPIMLRLMLAYNDFLYQVAATHPKIWKTIYRVMNLDLKSSAFFSFPILWQLFSVSLKKFFANVKSKLIEPKKNKAHHSKLRKLLKSNPLFKNISHEELMLLVKSAEKVQYRPGEMIVNENEYEEYFYIIKSGSVRVFSYDQNGNEIILARLEPANIFGERALSQELTRSSVNIKAITHVKLLKISRASLVTMLLQKLKAKSLAYDYSEQYKSKLLYSLFNKLVHYPISEFKDKETIFLKGAIPKNVFFILSGHVNIYLEEGTSGGKVIQLGPGSIFGELGVLENRLRAGSAVASGKVQAINLEADVFLKLHQQIPELQLISTAMRHSYKIPHRGIVTVKSGTFYDLDAINTHFKLPDGREVNAYQILNENMFIMVCEHTEIEKTIVYKTKKTANVSGYYELGLNNNKLVSVKSYGQWSELGVICGMLLDHVDINDWQIKIFQETGTLGGMNVSQKEIVCFCTQMTYSQIAAAIQSGDDTLEKLANDTGAGSICGSCRPKISEMLGNTVWSPVMIQDIIQASPHVNIYQLKPFKNEMLNYYPGQHVVIQVLIEKKWINRSYTLTSIDKNQYYEITVKKEPKGYLSQWLFKQMKHAIFIKISAPQGDFILRTKSSRPAIFFAGGIGITPALAFARFLAQEKSSKKLYIDYSAHSANEFIHKEELTNISKLNNMININFRETSKQGRITEDEIAHIIYQFPNGEYYICGPKGFQNYIASILRSHHVKDIFIENFTPSGAPLELETE